MRYGAEGSASGTRTSTSIIGLGASGVAAARLALSRGGEVHVSDLRTDAATAARGDELRAGGAHVELGRHDVARIESSQVVVVSPGIPPDAPVLRELRERGVRWISEAEFAFRFLQSALIAVTGTNGKTTVSALAAHLLEESGITVGLGGNIGAGFGPAASGLALLEPPPAWCVLEVSSFQLADVDRFRPDIGVVTNLAPDHLDRYPSIEAYYGDKACLFRNADSKSRWVLDGDDPIVDALAGDSPGKRYYVSTGASPRPWESGESAAGSPDDEGGFLDEGVLTLRLDGRDHALLPADALPLLGRHNHANALAAALSARLAGASIEGIREGLQTFTSLPHRLEPVADAGGILWVNDSKATNVAATCSAVSSLDRPILLLLGGKDKGEDLSPLRSAVAGRVRRAFVYGAARGRIAEALEGHVPIGRIDGSFDEAVHAAFAEALPGDVILLSPACSSFDAFTDYEERGRRFALIARTLASAPKEEEA